MKHALFTSAIALLSTVALQANDGERPTQNYL